MARPRSSIGFFGRFGRSQDLRQLDGALRGLDVHPSIIADAVKLTIVNLLKDQAIGAAPAPQAYRAASELIAYSVLGVEPFLKANGMPLVQSIEDRISRAVEAGDSLDAQLILLALEARIIQPSVVQRFELESDAE